MSLALAKTGERGRLLCSSGRMSAALRLGAPRYMSRRAYPLQAHTQPKAATTPALPTQRPINFTKQYSSKSTPKPVYELSTVEQILPSLKMHVTFCYKLPENYMKDYTMGVLRESLAATVKAIPVLGGEVYLDPESPQKGKRTIRPGKFENLFEKDYRGDRSKFPWTFNEFEERGFPLAPLKGDLFVHNSDIFPNFDKPEPVFRAQANFIDGGLILGISFSHAKMDARALFNVMNTWSQNFRDVSKGALPSAPAMGPEQFVNRSMTDGFKDGRKVKSHHEYIEAPTADTPASFLKENFQSKVYHFSPAALEQLKRDCSPADNSYWVSTNDAICALVWACVVSAQADTTATTTSDLSRPSYNTVCADSRLRCHPPLPEEHMGSDMVMVTPQAPLSTVVKRDLKALALAIRQSVKQVKPEYIDHLVSYFNQVDDFRRVRPHSFDGLMGDSIFMTSWYKMPFFTLGWGPLMSCEAIRPMTNGFFNGLMIFMPTPGDVGIDAVVGLDKSKTMKLEADPVWNKYAAAPEGQKTLKAKL